LLSNHDDRSSKHSAWKDEPEINPLDNYRPPDVEWMDTYDFYVPAGIIEMPYRFADYFQAYSFAYECKQSVQKQEANILYLIDHRFSYNTTGELEDKV
jgi:hypothetical protein